MKPVTGWGLSVAAAVSLVYPTFAQNSTQRSFEVFFEHDRSMITTEAEFVVREAVNYSRTISQPSVVVTAYADTLGSRSYNLKLSRDRARSVRTSLRASGIGNVPLTIRWVGELETDGPDEAGNPSARRAIIVVESRQ